MMKNKLKLFGRALGQRSVIGIPFIWLFLFFLLPFIIALKVSIAEPDYFPPYKDLISWASDRLSIIIYYDNYLFIFKDDDWQYLTPYIAQLKLAIITTLLCLVIGYLLAKWIAHLTKRNTQLAMLWLIATPTILAILLHLYANLTHAKNSPLGIVNHFLMNIGLVSQPLQLLNNYSIICLSVILVHLPLAVIPFYCHLNKFQLSVIPPASSQYRSFATFPKIPLLVSFLLVFICICGNYLIPNPLGIGKVSISLYLAPYLNSLELALFGTILCLLIGYPMAYAIAKAPKHLQTVLILLIIMPTWTALLIRVYAWMTILGNGENGILNQILITLGIIDRNSTIEVLNTYLAVYIGVVYSYLPFMVLPLYANLAKHDQSLLEAAADLGTKKLAAFWKITVPLSKNGIIAGCMLVFIPVIGEFVIPELLGGSETQLIGQTIYREYFNNNNWPSAAALAVIMLIILITPIVLFNRQQAKELEAK